MSSSNEGAVSEKTCLLSTDEQTSDAEETMANTEVLTEAHIPENRSPERVCLSCFIYLFYSFI